MVYIYACQRPDNCSEVLKQLKTNLTTVYLGNDVDVLSVKAGNTVVILSGKVTI